jgi:hypothetical protein
MAEQSEETRADIRAALRSFLDRPLREAAISLFEALGYASRKTVRLDGRPSSFLGFVDSNGDLSAKAAAQVSKWLRVDFLFQLTNDEIPLLAQGQQDLFEGEQDYRTSIIESFVVLAIELKGQDWARGQLAGITRELNRKFFMPVIVLFRHGDLASLAVIDRRPSKREASRDVVESKRISIVKDIDLRSPHRAHIDILRDIVLSRVKVRRRGTPTNFRDLYDGWIEALSAQALNERFYRELANWFFWSAKEVRFPTATMCSGPEREEQNQIAVIRLLTRLIFVWFIKEKGLVPDALFDAAALRGLLVEGPAARPNGSGYYKAVLQNLFFATLNTEISENRRWRTKASGKGLDGHYLIHSVYRHRDAFRDPDRALDLFRQVPFLNGGLFECLDREVSDRDLERNPDLKKWTKTEGSHRVIRVDGFSERPDNPLHVPNRIFFATQERVDLNAEYDTKGRSYVAVGLIELFSRYKFTVEENTPVEEEVALDPELLGKVFENLLASYNADTDDRSQKIGLVLHAPRGGRLHGRRGARCSFRALSCSQTPSARATPPYHGIAGPRRRAWGARPCAACSASEALGKGDRRYRCACTQSLVFQGGRESVQ